MTKVAPLVHGYVRMEEPDEVRIAVICKDVATFCKANGYRLGSVFLDRGVPGEQFARTGFTDLLAAVRLTEAQGVVVPTLEHLSPTGFIQGALVRMVELLGAQVLTTYQEAVETEMNADDHRLLEQTRGVNKTLSLLVFALQEEADITARNQHEVAAQLEALAEIIRARARADRARERAAGGWPAPPGCDHIAPGA